jgi:hypothetical protein
VQLEDNLVSTGEEPSPRSVPFDVLGSKVREMVEFVVAKAHTETDDLWVDAQTSNSVTAGDIAISRESTAASRYILLAAVQTTVSGAEYPKEVAVNLVS